MTSGPVTDCSGIHRTKIINYSELDMKGMQTLSATVSKRLREELGRSLAAETVDQILLMFQVKIEITDDGKCHLSRDKNLEAAVKYLGARF